MTSDGISGEDWDEVHQAAVDAVNAPDRGIAAANARMRRILDKLERRHGRLPSLVATRADYIDNRRKREALYLEAFKLSRRRGDIRNEYLVSHSLAKLCIDDLKDIVRGRKWLVEFQKRLLPGDKGHKADDKRLTKALNALEVVNTTGRSRSPRRDADSGMVDSGRRWGALICASMFLACLSSAGCVTTIADVRTGILVDVTVRDEARRPIGGATVTFVDTGLDYSRRSTSPRFVGTSDASGRMRTFFVYDWGYRYRHRSSKPPGHHVPGTFDLIVGIDGRAAVSRSFTLSDLPRADGGGPADRLVEWEAHAEPIEPRLP